MTRLGTTWSFTKFRLDAVGRVVPSPYTLTYPELVGSVAVTFNTTADTPVSGTPPWPATCSTTVPPGATAPVGAPNPVRVSNNRNGARDPSAPATIGVPERKYPETSATRCAVPGEPLNRSTWPSAPTGATTRLGTTWSFTKFRLDAVGRVAPSPKTVTNPELVGSATVTFSTTADTPVSGTPPWPATCNTTVPPGATAPFGAPNPLRVSSNRNGATDVKPPGVLTAAGTTAGNAAEAEATGKNTEPSTPARPVIHTVNTTTKRFIKLPLNEAPPGQPDAVIMAAKAHQCLGKAWKLWGDVRSILRR